MTDLTQTQKMILAHHGRISTSDTRTMNAFLGTLRGRVSYDRFPMATAHVAVIEREGDDAMDRMGIPAALRVGAILETYCGGGGQLGSFGVFAIWKRTETDWELVSAERQKFFGRRGHDGGKLKLTPEQIEFRTTQAAREAYAERARYFGERDDD